MKNNLLPALAVTLAMTIAMTPAVFSQDLLIEPDSLDFGQVAIGLAGLPYAYREITVTNQSDHDISLHVQTTNIAHPESFELFSPETAEIHPILRQIYDAVGCYRQDYGEDPNEAYDLVELGYLHIEEEILWRWQFSLIGQDPLTQIEAYTPRDQLVIFFDVQTGRFRMDHQGKIEPVLEFELESGNSRSFIMGYSPPEPEEIEGWISFVGEDRQARLHVAGSGFYKETLELSTDEIEFGSVYADLHAVRELSLTNSAGIAVRYEMEFSDPAKFYVFEANLLGIHNFMLTIYRAFLNYTNDQNIAPRSINQLIQLGYLNGEDPMFDEWRFYFRLASVTASSTDQFEFGSGYELRLNLETKVFSGDGFNFGQEYRRTLGKDRRLDLLAGFAPNNVGEFAGEVRIRAYAGEGENDFQNYIIRLSGNGLSVASSEPGTMPETILLSPTFPNPFNSTAIVSFQTPFAGQLDASLLDVNGRVWTRWTSLQAAPGAGKFLIDGNGLAAGTYWVKVAQGGQSAMQRVELVK